MRISRWFLAALTAVIAALVIHRVARRIPVEAPRRPDSTENATIQIPNLTTDPRPRAKEPLEATESASGRDASTTNGSASNVGVRGAKLPRPSTNSAPETQAAETAAKPAAVQSSFSQGPPPTPVAPLPIELFRTNSVENPPGKNRSYAGP